MLPTNVRLDWKVIARYKHSSLLGLIISDKGKKFYNIDLLAVLNLFSSLMVNEFRLVRLSTEPWLKEKAHDSGPPCTKYFRSAAFDSLNIIYFFTKQAI